MKKLLIIAIVASTAFTACKKKGCTNPLATNYNENATKDDGSCNEVFELSEPLSVPSLIIKLHFDSLAPRLDNFGNPESIPTGNSAQSPRFHGMSAHYIELAQSPTTQLGAGKIIYHGAETTAGGSNAVDFDQAITAGDNEVFLQIPLSELTADTYNWIRVSLSYQNYDIDYRASGLDLSGRIASFVGFNNYITSHVVETQTVNVNANKLQGYWAFETLGQISEGDAVGTTVPNPLSATSPIPSGSCVVTGDFDVPFIFTGNETEDIVLTLNMSTNNSFEWTDANQNGIYEPLDGDVVVDMGLRGIDPVIQ